jgi:hypothetical protein
MTKKPPKPTAAPVPAAPPPEPPPAAEPRKRRSHHSPNDTRKPTTPPDAIPPVALPQKKPRKKVERDLPPGFEPVFSDGKHKGKPRCISPRKEDDPDRGINPDTGRPYRRASAFQCGNVAAPGYKRCSRHGVTPAKRVKAGKAPDSRAAGTAAQWPGFERLGPNVRKAADSYAGAGPDCLTDLTQVLILAHVQLETSMLVQREALDLYETAKDKAADEPGDAIVALDRVSAIGGRTSSQLETVLKVIDTMTKKSAAGEGVITPSQFLFTLNQMQERVRQLCADPAVPRAEIADRLIDWLHAFVSGQATAPGKT